MSKPIEQPETRRDRLTDSHVEYIDDFIDFLDAPAPRKLPQINFYGRTIDLMTFSGD